MSSNRARSSRVRPYALTRGRTRARRPLQLETLISVPRFDRTACAELTPECAAIYRLCRDVRSVVEVGAELRMPVGVVRVLVSDLADEGRVEVHATGGALYRSGSELLERVLRGLQTLSR